MNRELDSEAELARRFNWWWRGVFVGMRKELSELGSIAALWKWNEETEKLSVAEENVAEKDINALFGLLNLRRERSAFLYELQKRVAGRYEMGKAWIFLNERQRGAD